MTVHSVISRQIVHPIAAMVPLAAIRRAHRKAEILGQRAQGSRKAARTASAAALPC
jgi:hypothetical protein